MMLWWLSFRGGSALIIEAESLAHARLLAAVNELGRASHLLEGHSVDPDLVTLIPDDFIGRKLFAEEAEELLGLLKHGPPRRSAKPILQLRPTLTA
jgi:hypothetical protein